MPSGKAAGVRCMQLDDAERCLLFGRPERPAVCASLRPTAEMCGDSRAQALLWISQLEVSTQPSHQLRAAAARRARKKKRHPRGDGAKHTIA